MNILAVLLACATLVLGCDGDELRQERLEARDRNCVTLIDAQQPLSNLNPPAPRGGKPTPTPPLAASYVENFGFKQPTPPVSPVVRVDQVNRNGAAAKPLRTTPPPNKDYLNLAAPGSPLDSLKDKKVKLNEDKSIET